MSLRYSPSTGGFYETQLHSAIPEDAGYVSPSRHAELMDAQAEGAAIVASPDTGNPVIHHPAAHPSADDLRARLTEAVKREARRRIEIVSPQWRQLNDLRLPSEDGVLRFAILDAIRDASDAIEEEIATAPVSELESFDVRGNSLWPQDD